jgi:hypothetical protein
VQYEHEGEWLYVASATTDRDGEAIIRDLSPATYRLFVSLPNNYVFGPLGQKINLFYNCVNPDGYTEPFAVETRETFGMGIGAVKGGSVSGRLWRDENVNGILDPGEGGLENAAVTLYSPALGISRTVYTEESGAYAFQNVQPGEHQVLIDNLMDKLPDTEILGAVAELLGLFADGTRVRILYELLREELCKPSEAGNQSLFRVYFKWIKTLSRGGTNERTVGDNEHSRQCRRCGIVCSRRSGWQDIVLQSPGDHQM